MARKADVPNAWDDDWEAEADKQSNQSKHLKKSKPRQIDDAYIDDEDTPFSGGALLTQPPADADETGAKPVLLSRAERLAQHAEKNRKLWETADNPEEFHFLSANTNANGSSAPTILAPAAAFRPAMTVLSRKPAPQMIRRRDPVTGLEQLTMSDDAAEAEAEARAAAARKQETPEQIRLRQHKEREERQRKYNEARAKIFGEPVGGSNGSNNNNNGNSSNGTTASQSSPPTPKAGNNTPLSPPSHNGRRGRGRGGQGGQGGGGSNRGNSNGSSSNNGSSRPSQKLFDPNYSPKPGSRRQGAQNMNGLGKISSSEASPFPSRTGTPQDDEFVTRAPKGPDGSGRGGFGFSRRGGS